MGEKTTSKPIIENRDDLARKAMGASSRLSGSFQQSFEASNKPPQELIDRIMRDKAELDKAIAWLVRDLFEQGRKQEPSLPTDAHTPTEELVSEFTESYVELDTPSISTRNTTTV